MALEGFKPTLWSGILLEQLKKSLVFNAVANRDYEGEITNFGDRVKINEIGAITVSDYTDTTTVTPQILGDAQKELLIDQAKYFAFKVDDVTAAQMKPKVMQAAMVKAAYTLRDKADQYLARLYGEAGVLVGSTGSAVSINSVNIIEQIGLMEQGLNEANVPLEGRWMVLTPWMHQKLVLAKVQIITDNSGVFDNGFVGKALGFNLYLSNNIYEATPSSHTGAKILAGHSMAITIAEQLTKMEAYRPEATFSDAVKGLYVWGAKVVMPSALACLTATYAAEP